MLITLKQLKSALQAVKDYVTSVVPTKTSELTNDSGFITSYTETDPTVPSWAKAASKPTYTAAEVGALPSSTVIPTVPTNVSAFTNDANYQTAANVTAAISTKQDALPTGIAGQVLTLDNNLSPTWGEASGATYSLSMTNNTITLTGSDGTSSSITLPVYTGGVTS